MKLMNRKTAIIMLSSVAILGLAGCGGTAGDPSDSQLVGSVPGIPTVPPVGEVPPAAPEDPCPGIPSAVKQPATLDQNKTKIAVGTALVSAEIAYMLSDGGMYYWGPAEKKSAEEPKENSKLASLVSAKVKTLQENTAAVKKTINASEDGVIEWGDDIACDSGTYSAQHYEDSSNDGEEDGVDSETWSEKLTLSFNECVLEDNDANSDLIRFFNDATMHSFPFMHYRVEEESRVYTYNGSLALEYNNAYEYEDWSIPEPSDHGYGDKRNQEGNAHLTTEALSVQQKVGDALRESYISTEDLATTFNGAREWSNTYVYDSDAAWEDGNYTRNDVGDYTGNASVVFEGSSKYQQFGETNEIMELTALCYSAEMTFDDDYNYTYHYTQGEQDAYENQWHSKSSIESNGYLALKYQNGEEVDFLDMYADGLKVEGSWNSNNSNERDEEGHWNSSEYSRSGALSMNGTVGSMLMGGSVLLDTQDPWLMSSEYPNDRSSLVQPHSIGYGYFYFEYSPYAGKTLLTGTNTATVEFKYETVEEEPYTYGVITVEGEDPVEYDSVYEMLDMI